MDPVSPQVVPALQAVLRIVRTGFSQFHDQEHMSEYQGYGKLQSFYDKLTYLSRCHRRTLLDRIFELDGVPDPTMEPARQALSDAPQAIIQTIDLLKRQHEAYRVAIAVMRDANDTVSLEMLSSDQRDVEKWICKADRRWEKLSKMGQQVWHGTVAQ